MTKHTQGEWYWAGKKLRSRKGNKIVPLDPNNNLRDKAEIEANRNLIIKACNHYYKMLELLKRCQDDYKVAAFLAELESEN